MGKSYTKAVLIKELAQAAAISQRRVEVVLEALSQIAYREARDGFAVPGICRLDVVRRQARLVRNPQTNQTLQIDEHDALRVRPVKRARDAIAPAPRARVPAVDELPPETPASTLPPAPAIPLSAAPAAPLSAAPAAPLSTTPVPNAPPPATSLPAGEVPEDGLFVSFRCRDCGQEMEAPLEMIGAANECPSCGETLIVPATSEAGTIWYQQRVTSPEKLPPTPSAIAAMKGRTIRIELPDDF